ncbi:hypothetical protein FVE85_6374 [Porphyridium purpureum]|uniref:Uncharacterized protein n=1 Tax=Porphyridium purpureum TaxID=35688 RepID=A0A5J4Z478_PORPP|nr:hypothetical protein FVE85_6374 [Porphyridium purpureum]|eukprot:POR3462..scf295_1
MNVCFATLRLFFIPRDFVLRGSRFRIYITFRLPNTSGQVHFTTCCTLLESRFHMSRHLAYKFKAGNACHSVLSMAAGRAPSVEAFVSAQQQVTSFTMRITHQTPTRPAAHNNACVCRIPHGIAGSTTWHSTGAPCSRRLPRNYNGVSHGVSRRTLPSPVGTVKPMVRLAQGQQATKLGVS